MTGNSPSRKPLHERSHSDTNTKAGGAIRIVPQTPPRLLGQRDDVYLRTPLPTHPSHILSPGREKGKDVTSALQYKFQPSLKPQPLTGSSGSSVAATHISPRPPQSEENTPGPSNLRPKPIPKKRLRIHKDNKTKTFSLVEQDAAQPEEDLSQSPKSPPTLSTRSSFASLQSVKRSLEVRSNSVTSCDSAVPAIGLIEPSTPVPDIETIREDHISNSLWSYGFVGGLRKVQKTPDLKTAASESESPLPPLSETYDGPTSPVSHDLSTKLSFQSTETAPSTLSANSNYKVYRNVSASASEAALASPSSSNSNYQLLGDPSPESSVIYRPQSAISESENENENYELHDDPSPNPSYVSLQQKEKYSQESLIIPPLKPRTRRSSENLGYYKQRSRESLRSGSLTSISTILSQQQAHQALVGSGSLIDLPILNPKVRLTGSWAEQLSVHPLRSHMQEHPHQWSSQLSTVHSVSDSGTNRGSRSWSDDNERRSSQFVPSTPSPHSRQMMSISSSFAQEETERGDYVDIEPPRPAFVRNLQRNNSSSSIPQVVGDQDEYGDGLTDMQDLRNRPSRTRLSGLISITSSDNGRTNTIRSTSSSRLNSLVATSIPIWAKIYYGSGERRYLGAPGSSTEGTDSRNNSFRTGSPNTDHLPLSIFSPRRRPRELNALAGPSANRASIEITPVPQVGNDRQLIHEPYSRKFRTWSLSSVWSPHLKHDRRATRQSMWEPPSVNWSTEGSLFGRRNVQIVMFITGFIFPFCKYSASRHLLKPLTDNRVAWMIAAFLPLPNNPMSDMEEKSHSTSNISSNRVPNDYTRQFGPMDEARFESAKWWRGLNRWMSMVGILIIAVIVSSSPFPPSSHNLTTPKIILVVISVKQGW